jgi:hypothetical protein
MRKCIIARMRNAPVAPELYLHDISPRGLRYFSFEPCFLLCENACIFYTNGTVYRVELFYINHYYSTPFWYLISLP